MTDKPTSTNNVDTNECKCKYQLLCSNECGCYAESEKGVCIRLCRDVPLKGCCYMQASLEIARKQLSDEQQKVYKIHQIYKKYSTNYITNAGIKLMNEIADIIGDKTSE